jgi:hypothetical protein
VLSEVGISVTQCWVNGLDWSFFAVKVVAEAYRTMVEEEFRTSRIRSGTVEDKSLGVRRGVGNRWANNNLALLNEPRFLDLVPDDQADSAKGR